MAARRDREARVGWLATALLVAAAGCGSGGNDQGIVFRATGIFRGLESIEQGKITCTEPNVTNAIVDTAFTLSIGPPTLDFPNRKDPFADPCGGYIALQNNLTKESMNVQEILIRYEVPGASIQVPPNPVSFGQTILPASSTATTPSGQPNVIFAELVGQIVPRNIIVFLNQYTNRLPATPYLMNVFMVARGQADDGTRYQTNEIGYQLTIVP